METETAYAKINLALHVRRRRADGYHDLETLFAFAEDGDRLAGEVADALLLMVGGPFAQGLNGDDNLVLRAARALAAEFGITAGARLTLDKRLPVASGIGGGSADAAAALRLLARLWGLDAGDERLLAVARGIGADVPACLQSTALSGTGRGDVLVPAASLNGTPLLLVNPLVAVPTAAVFKGWDGVDRGPLADGEPMEAASAGRNDLTAAALTLAPSIGPVLETLAAMPGVRLARMSGSGATCFALFEQEDQRDSAAAMMRERFENIWLLATRLR